MTTTPQIHHHHLELPMAGASSPSLFLSIMVEYIFSACPDPIFVATSPAPSSRVQLGQDLYLVIKINFLLLPRNARRPA